MNLTVNGESRQLPPDTTVEGLIATLGLSDAICAAEVNERVIPRSERAGHVLADGDRVEIVTLVGGG